MLFAHQLGMFRRDLSLVADLEDAQTFVERLRAGARWVIPNSGRSGTFSLVSQRVAQSVVHGLANFDLQRIEDLANRRRARTIGALWHW